MKIFNLIILLFLTVIKMYGQAPAIIPQPVEMQVLKGKFALTATTTIGASSAEARNVAAVLINKIKPATGFNLKIQNTGGIQLILNKNNNTKLGNEGYSLNVTPQLVTITANKEAGLYYGVQTLLQLLPKEIESKSVVKKAWSIPSVKITDYPRFAWRGMMLDVSRHFFSKDDVKRFIDDMARYKYNTFHWHLTDDEGWRIEIKSLPKLTQVGACRVKRYGKFGGYEAPKPGEPATDCGYYTQDDIRDVIAYATARHITIVPEIDVPGHSMAAVASYPELSCTKDTSVKVSPGFKFAEWYGNGQFKMLVDNTLNPSSDKVYEFLDKVFTEVAALFPNPYIHMGGDECYHGYWEQNADCQALMKKEGLKNSHELQSYFVKRVEKIVNSKGKKLIGWDEILEGGLAPNASVMSWRGYEGGIEAAKQGHDVVMTPNDYVYTDLLQGEIAVEPDQTSYKTVRLKKSFEFEPVPDGIDPKYVLGGQANLWSEKVASIRQAQYMNFPRAWTLADTYWSPKGTKNWDNFISRMEKHMERCDVAGINYARSAYDAIVTPTVKDGKVLVDITTEINGLDIFYTIDETIPDTYSPQYKGTLEVPNGNSVTLKVATYKNGKPVGRIVPLSRDELLKRAGKK